MFTQVDRFVQDRVNSPEKLTATVPLYMAAYLALQDRLRFLLVISLSQTPPMAT